MSDLPRPTSKPAPARRWSPQRPGDLKTPQDVPTGGAFGAIGPDTGYAALLIADREIALAPNEDRHQVDAAVTALAGARASRCGRAPTGEDIDIALLLLGYDEEAQADPDLAAERQGWLAGLGHGSAGGRGLVAAVRPEVLTSTPGEIRARRRAGEALIER
jgi:hypothetical protein